MLFGVLVIPDGQHKRQLQQDVLAIFTTDMAGRVLPYDGDAADAHAEFAAMRRAQGRPVGMADAMIAGVTLVDPWH